MYSPPHHRLLLEINMAVSNLMLLLCWWCLLRVIIGSVCLTELHVNTYELDLCNSKTEKLTFVKYPPCIFETLNVDKIVTAKLSQSSQSPISLCIYFHFLIFMIFFYFISLPALDGLNCQFFIFLRFVPTSWLENQDGLTPEASPSSSGSVSPNGIMCQSREGGGECHLFGNRLGTLSKEQTVSVLTR